MITRQEARQILSAVAVAKKFSINDKLYLSLSAFLQIFATYCEGNPTIKLEEDSIDIKYPDDDPKQSGMTLIEAIVGLSISMIMVLVTVTMMANQARALKHYQIRSEMIALLSSASLSGDGCKSVKVSGGIPKLGICGSGNTPQTIEVLYTDGSRVDTSSTYLLQGDCNPGFYALQVKSASVTKIDPFNQQAIGANWMAPAAIRFAEKAWLAGGCP